MELRTHREEAKPKECEAAGCDTLHPNAVEGDKRFAGWRCYAHRMSFGAALVALKSGKKLTRSLEDGWYVILLQGSQGSDDGMEGRWLAGRLGVSHMRVARLLARIEGAWYGSPRLLVWEPTQEDILAEDWFEWVNR